MDYRNEKHRIAFVEAIQKLNRKDYALMSAAYLLTTVHSLWMKAKRRVWQNKICFDAIKLQNSTENSSPYSAVQRTIPSAPCIAPLTTADRWSLSLSKTLFADRPMKKRRRNRKTIWTRLRITLLLCEHETNY